MNEGARRKVVTNNKTAEYYKKQQRVVAQRAARVREIAPTDEGLSRMDAYQTRKAAAFAAREELTAQIRRAESVYLLDGKLVIMVRHANGTVQGFKEVVLSPPPLAAVYIPPKPRVDSDGESTSFPFSRGYTPPPQMEPW